MNKLLSPKQTFVTLLSKVTLILRLSLIFLFAFSFQINAKKTNSQNAKNSLEKNNSIENVFLTNEDSKVSLLPIENNEITTKLSASEQQQEKTISGRVVDTQGETIIGANVIEKGTTNGTITDADGNFTLNVGNDAVLVISYIGYMKEEVPTQGMNRIDVILMEDTQTLEELVVVGYTTVEKGRLTGSVVEISGDVLAQSPSVDLGKSLQGRLPGLKINNRGGEPGAPATEILVRGKSTLGNSAPLIIIDGVPRTQDDFINLSSEDIDEISVLKDAAAAIYGARAANGVIMVQTKRGKAGESQISIDSKFGYSWFSRLPDLLNSYEYAIMKNEIEEGYGRGPFFSQDDLDKYLSGDSPLTHGNVENWYKYTYKDLAPQTQTNVSATGGTDKVRYFIGGEYLHKGSQYWSGDGYFDRYQVRSNVDAQVTSFLKIGADLSGSIRKRHYPQFQPWYEILQIKPYAVGTFPTGEYGSGIAGINFRNVTSDRTGYQEEDVKSIRTNFSFDLNMDWLTEGLSLLGNAAFDFDNSTYMNYFEPTYVYNYDQNTGELIPRWAYGGSIRQLDKRWGLKRDNFANIRLNYNRSFNDHNFSAFAGYEQMQGYNETLRGYRWNVISKLKLDLDLADTNQQKSNGSSGEYGRVNYFAYLGYDYQKKYLVDFTFRRDGSSNFPEKGRFGNFPSLSLGWNISKENFMASATDSWLDNLKIRASYATMGNDQIAQFQYLSKYSATNFHIFGDNGGARYNVLSLTNIGNPNVTWEKSQNFNLGFDANMFDNKLVVNFDYFYEKRRDILISRSASVPDYTGLMLPPENLGKVDNEGIEMIINYQDKVGDLNFNINGNVQFSDNRIVYMDEPEDTPDYRRAEGRPIDGIITYKTNGIFRDKNDLANPPEGVVVIPGQQPGDIRYVDMNKDGVIDGNDQYRMDISATPKLQYGINPGLEYKGFSLNLFFYGQAMVKTPIIFDKPVERLNVPSYYYKLRWTEENKDGPFPRSFPGVNQVNYRNSDFWVFNASYIALNNVTLSYNLPTSLLSHTPFSGIQLYAKGSDLWIIWDGISARTGQKDIHPELGTSSLGGSVSWNPLYYYPQQATFTFGVRINFSN